MTTTDRLKAALESFVTRVMERVRYLPVFAGKVSSQKDDLTLEITPDLAAMPGLTKVPIRTFVPGATVKVIENARCVVAFEDGDPSKPVALLFKGGPDVLKELTIENANHAKLSLVEAGDAQLVVDSGKFTTIGQTSGAQKLPMGEDLKSYIDNSVKTQFNQFLSDYGTHTHPFAWTTGGGSGTTSAPSTASTATSIGNSPALAQRAKAG